MQQSVSSFLAGLVICSLFPPRLLATLPHTIKPTQQESVLFLSFQTESLVVNQRNPVVNEGRQLTLTVSNSNGQPVPDVTWESGSPDVAQVDAQGLVTGITRGFATITARRGSSSVSTFVVVTRVTTGQGPKSPGDTRPDQAGRLYLTDPLNHVIRRKSSLTAVSELFAGRSGETGFINGPRQSATFRTPTQIALDNSSTGGIYVADTANHAIRKINLADQVSLVAGNGAPGVNLEEITALNQAQFRGLRGIVIDSGGNLFVADTENQAIYYIDFAQQQVRLLAGAPGVPGLIDGAGRSARFRRPTSLALSSDGKIVAVVDEGNNRVRLITRSGEVRTLGRAVSRQEGDESRQASSDIEFDTPQSVSFDGTGNVYVVDRTGPKVVTQALGQVPQLIDLAQPGVSFQQAASVAVQGAQTFILDAQSPTDAEAIKVVTVGAPEIATIEDVTPTLNRLPISGGTAIRIRGKNFAPESRVVVGDQVTVAQVMSATEIQLALPPQKAPGRRTISIQTRGGVAQIETNLTSNALIELSTGQITTTVGGVSFSGNGGLATRASLLFAQTGGLALDSLGNMYVADSANHRVRRIDVETGVITTVAGNGIAGFSGDGQLAVSASLNQPEGVVIDPSGNLFIADTGNHRIRRVDISTGTIGTAAGNGTPGFGGDGGEATRANLSNPTALALDLGSQLLIADTDNHRIRRVNLMTRQIETIAGTGIQGFTGDGGLAIQAALALPRGLAFTPDGGVLIADFGNNRIRRITSQGLIEAVAGNGGFGFSGDNGPALGASFRGPSGIALDVSGNLLIADSGNHRIRRVSSNGVITTVIGNGTASLTGDGGPALTAGLNTPTSIVVDSLGNVFLTDRDNRRLRRREVGTLLMSTIAGTDISVGDDTPATAAELRFPTAVMQDASGNTYLTDTEQSRIRRISAQGNITTIGGTGANGFSGDSGLAVNARINRPTGLVIDGQGNVYFSDTFNHRIRRINPGGVVTTIAGIGIPNFTGDNGPAGNASLNFPQGLTLDQAGNLFVADTGNNRIRRITPDGIISTFAGNGANEYNGDNLAATSASLAGPSGVAVGPEGVIYIADTLNDRIRRVGPDGILTTVAGNGTRGFSGDGGPATSSSLNLPRQVLIDSKGNLYISDSANQLIRRVNAQTQTIATVAGNQVPDYAGDNQSAAQASLNNPRGLFLDRDGNLLVADSANNAIRAVKSVADGGTAPDVLISNVVYQKPVMTISGNGFGMTGAIIRINGTDVSSFLTTQTDSSLLLRGKPKKLKLKKGNNEIVVVVNGVLSNVYAFEY